METFLLSLVDALLLCRFSFYLRQWLSLRFPYINLQPLQTETYRHYNIYIEEFIYNEAEGRLIVFLKLERLRYQLLLNSLNID